jgi:hypothetical protein
MWADVLDLNRCFSIKQYIFIQGWTFNECPHERKASSRQAVQKGLFFSKVVSKKD